MYEKSVGQISIITEQDMLGMRWLKFWQSFIEICRLENWYPDFHIFMIIISENIKFETFVGKSIHLYIQNHFTTYFARFCSIWSPKTSFSSRYIGCKAAHKIYNFWIFKLSWSNFRIQSWTDVSESAHKAFVSLLLLSKHLPVFFIPNVQPVNLPFLS